MGVWANTWKFCLGKKGKEERAVYCLTQNNNGNNNNNHWTLIMTKHNAVCIIKYLFNEMAKWQGSETLSNPGRPVGFHHTAQVPSSQYFTNSE